VVLQKIYFLLLIFICTNSNAQMPFYCAEKTHTNLQWECLGPKHDSSQLANQNFGAITAICANPKKDSLDIYIGAYSGGLWHTTDGGANWVNLTDNFPKNVSGVKNIIVDFDASPRTITISSGQSFTWIEGAQAGVLQSLDDGKHWQAAIFKRNDGSVFYPTIDALIKDNVNSENYFASAEGAIWRSTNNCKSFEKIFPITNEHKKIFDREPYHHFLGMVLYDNNLYISSEYQHYWDGVKDNVYYPDLLELKNIYSNNITITSLNKEVDEYVKNANTKQCLGTKIAVCAADNNILHIYKTYMNATKYVTLLEYNMKEHYFENSIEPNLPLESFNAVNVAGLLCNAKNKAVHYLSAFTFHQSKDSCQSFQASYGYSFGENNTPHTDIRSAQIIYSSADGKSDHILLGTDGGLSYSSNSGKTYKNLNGAYLPITQFYGLGVSQFDGNITLGAQDNSLMTYVAANKKWKISINGDGYDAEYAQHQKGLLYGEYNFQTLQVSRNGEAPCNNNSGLNHNDENNPNKNLRCTKNGNVYFGGGNKINKLALHQTQWQALGPIPGMGNYLFAYDICEVNEDIMYAANIWNGATNTLLKSIDAGKTWQDISTNLSIDSPNRFRPDMYRILRIYCSPNNELDVWIGLGYASDYNNPCNGYNRIMHSKNGGETWMDESKGLPAIGVSDIVLIEGTDEAMFVATNEGVYFKELWTDDWQLYGSKQPMSLVSELKIDYCQGDLLMSSYGRGLWRVSLPKDIQYNNYYTLKDKIDFTDSTRDYVLQRDIYLKKNETLPINAAVYIANNRKIYCYHTNQIVFGNKGKLLNGCNNNYNAIAIRTKRKKKFLLF
jgi:hypothetical protein